MKDNRLTFIDLFCGCGGWTEGFSLQGFHCAYAVDNWKPAALTHSFNHPGIEKDAEPKDILDDNVIEQVQELISDGVADVLIGSPPCTSFSYSNRGGSGNTTEGMILVRRFLEVVDFAQNDLGRKDFPWVMENVPRLKNFLEKGYTPDTGRYRFNYVNEKAEIDVCIPRIVVLNAADYGAFQKRKRCFCGNFSIPTPTHASPEVLSDKKKLEEFANYHEMTKEEVASLKPWRTLRELFASLPRPDANKDIFTSEIKDPNFNFSMPSAQLNDHFYDTSIQVGAELYETHELKQHHPVYGVMSFPEKLDEPARTIMATEMRISRETMVLPKNVQSYSRFVGKKNYEEVLKESNATDVGGYRRPTLRELACIQGFPIDYQFSGKTTGVKHRQIGNAVSPMISRAFAQAFLKKAFGLNPPDYLDSISYKRQLRDTSRFGDFKISTKCYRGKQKFKRHLRSTKAHGERIDLQFNPKVDDGWQVLLTLGSGKDFTSLLMNNENMDKVKTEIRRVFQKESLLSKQDSFAQKTQKQLVEMKKHINARTFKNFNVTECFDDKGSVVPGTPLAVIEDTIETAVRNILRGHEDISEKINVPINSKTRKKEISFKNAISLLASYTIVQEINWRDG